MAVQKVEHPMLDYKEKTKSSERFMEEAQQVMPGGVTANIKYFDPHPVVMKHGKGAKLTDVDDNEYIDYLMSYGSLVTGHGHERVKKAVMDQMEQDGTWLFGTPHYLEVEMGKRLKQHFPSMERLRYTNSGTEATLLSLRLAAAHTGKHKIAKFEGHYHGGYDQMLISVNPNVESAGDADTPKSLPESKGMHPAHVRNTIALPFNNLEACKQILTEHKDEVGAVMIEPVQAGFIPAELSFMKGLRAITEQLGIVLIFDEVKTGYRMGLGGAQALYGVKPDLTTLGKAIGGGYPVGVVGGKEEIMMHSAASQGSDVFDSSTSKRSSAKDVLFHSGTYNGHPMILAAGMAVLDILEKDLGAALKRTEALKNGINETLRKYGVKGEALGIGTIFSVILNNDGKVRNYRDLQQTDLATRKEIDFRLLNKGIYIKPMSRYSVSTAHTDEDINKTITAYDDVLREVYGGARF
ncbi:glutamate-1-semialdehyde 2,1-aminomutase [Alteribacillus persepolensis]|uniref:Glutamate-1-semialdehyde 2,1-aminomutase n=1 Tax=Alteribacillus persepolensis TaxID=568899 RepID=A0A1G8H562_9BACI|nr:aspartate aminotransferase family protein [Alteribacillus persepolensis]SDI01709.1 glutamate-1-semialdehyde 2,1-aminomutase [Alteribacillus persepolensis]